MRVHLDENEKELYNKYVELFTELQSEAEKNGITGNITNLPAYFSTLQKLLDKKVRPKYKFLRLPLDEPYFTVDLNSRTIKVPSEFSQYGIGVKGDANAEVIFFETDRFFDGVDLFSNDLECWIQWQNVADKTMGNSVGILKDADPNKCYIGWMITDEMTKTPGNIEFALRWFKLSAAPDGTKKMTYSIGTQKATCAVKQALDLDVEELTPDRSVEDLIFTRPIYSGVINSLNGPAAAITKTLDNSKWYDLAVPSESETELYAAYEQFAETLDSDLVHEGAHDGVYKFEIAASAAGDGATLEYKWYNGKNVIPGATAASYIAGRAGQYQVQVGNTTAEYGTRWTPSPIVTIPAANAITLSDKSKFPEYIMSQEGNNILSVLVDGTPNGKLVYDWETTDLNGENAQAVTAESTYTVPVDFEGYVSCSVRNRKNNTLSAAVAPKNKCLVRAMPKKIVPKPTLELNPIAKTLTAKISTEALDPITAKHLDELYYTWYVAVGDNAPNTTTEHGDTFKLSTLKAGNTYYIHCSVLHIVKVMIGGTQVAEYYYKQATHANPIQIEIAQNGTITAKD